MSYFPVVNNRSVAIINIYLEGLDKTDGPFELTRMYNKSYFPGIDGTELLAINLVFNFRAERTIQSYQEKLAQNVVSELERLSFETSFAALANTIHFIARKYGELWCIL